MVQVNINSMIAIIKIENCWQDSHTGIKETVANFNSTGREVCNPKVDLHHDHLHHYNCHHQDHDHHDHLHHYMIISSRE